MPTKLTDYDPAQDLFDPTDQAKLIAEAYQTGDTAFITSAIETVVRAHNLTRMAEQAEVTRVEFCKALKDGNDPQLATMIGVTQALGIHICATV